MEPFAFRDAAQASTAVVVLFNDGWEAFPFGWTAEARASIRPREQAIGSVESMAGDVRLFRGAPAELIRVAR